MTSKFYFEFAELHNFVVLSDTKIICLEIKCYIVKSILTLKAHRKKILLKMLSAEVVCCK